ncbi:MAG: DUF2087 domain-containing protein [Bacillota bacterium]
MSHMEIVNRFLDEEGRIRQMPAKRAKVEALLDYLVEQFETGRLYAEREINEVLLRFHPDFCTLRRYLVDTRRMARNSLTGQYWRTAE